jgi:glutaredoxin
MTHYVLVYTTHCPKCKILEKTLESKGIHYSTIEDVDKMIELGITTVPQMVVDCGSRMDFKTAMMWIKENYDG